jgi:MFS family permease
VGRVAATLGYPNLTLVSAEKRQGMRAFWMDGLFSSLSGAFADPYYTLYLLSLNASNAQIGLVNTLNQLVGALLSFPGASIASRTGRYKGLVLLCGVLSRLMWVVMLAAPLLLGMDWAVWLVLFAWVALSGINALGNAAWTALSADLVPPRFRGGYFASRNTIIHLVRLAAIPLAGQLIYAVGEPEGYQVSLGIAFAIGLIAVYYYAQIPEHSGTFRRVRVSMRRIVTGTRDLPNFTRFVASHSTLQLGVMLSGPFINVYMVEEAGFNVGVISLVATVSVASTLVGMRIMGRVHDRLGITSTMRFGLLIPLIPVAWLWVRHPWQAYLVETFSALTWAGYNLGAFNLLLASTPDDHRPQYVALYTTLVSVVGGIGPVIGGWLLDWLDFGPAFTISAVVRGLGFVLFFVLVREPEVADPDESAGESGDEAA